MTPPEDSPGVTAVLRPQQAAPDPDLLARRRALRRARAAAAAAENRAAVAPVPQPEPEPARPKPRHWGALAVFVLLVVLPFAAVVGYLWTRAADQYHSEVAFSVRSEEVASAGAGILGALTQIGSGTASDTDILYEYVRSQEIVEAIGAELDLRTIFNRAEGDPVFTLGDAPSIEALLAHWRRMVEVSYDSAAGIIHVRVNAFTPGDARAIAEAIMAKSGALVNQLSEQAREDAVRFAREELVEAEASLRAVRQRLAGFRRAHNIVDPSADVAGQMGLLSALQAELAQALVDRDVLLSYAAEGDQRVIQADRRIEAITARIEDERGSLELTGVAGSLPEVVGRYEELLVDLEFANTAYTQALAGLSAARAEARRQSRYLAPHVRPTLAESALYPRRVMLAGLAGLFLVLGWSVLMLVYYNVRDNR
jgi:capsular polysaccharide transport system permease protein